MSGKPQCVKTGIRRPEYERKNELMVRFHLNGVVMDSSLLAIKFRRGRKLEPSQRQA